MYVSKLKEDNKGSERERGRERKKREEIKCEFIFNKKTNEVAANESE